MRYYRLTKHKQHIGIICSKETHIFRVTLDLYAGFIRQWNECGCSGTANPKIYHRRNYIMVRFMSNKNICVKSLRFFSNHQTHPCSRIFSWARQNERKNNKNDKSHDKHKGNKNLIINSDMPHLCGQFYWLTVTKWTQNWVKRHQIKWKV